MEHTTKFGRFNRYPHNHPHNYPHNYVRKDLKYRQ